jgi:tRNA pseudouridine55 synthase
MPTTSTDSLVLVDKPAGITSFGAVRAVGRVLGNRRVGHSGTLDPFATGLLVVLAGRATRLMQFVPDEPKVYLATIRFGTRTDTDDATGSVTGDAPLPDPEVVRRALPSLTGMIRQVPPGFSAKKVEGRRAYAIARAGAPPVLDPVDVRVDRWEVVTLTAESMVARIHCGRGTYIRALARDLGTTVGSAAHLTALRREGSGPFRVEGATTWDDIGRGMVDAMPARTALGNLPEHVLSADDVRRVAHGMTIPAASGADRVQLLDASGDLIAVAVRHADRWQPNVVLVDG